MGCNFYAMLSRMKYIDRWGLMNNTRKENISEHSLEVAILAHALVLIGNARFQKKLDAQRAATLALFHDCPEILTGDLPLLSNTAARRSRKPTGRLSRWQVKNCWICCRTI